MLTCDFWQKPQLPENLTVNSPHPGKAKESDTLDYEYVSAQNFCQIDSKPTDIVQITTFHDHNNPPVGLAKKSKLGSPPLEGPEFVQGGEEFQAPLNADSNPHTLDQTQEQSQTRVFKTRVSAL